ncbi:hypothetical protein [uncultured Gilliamella sp.]|uniref:hypothetical protein n=1 Tax=uncultured Gilliamella sp. TaxID=1193505 RepID=UPI0025DF7B89|nr:hypothetical protein [uncultured Gilliamella sp.]
MLKYSRLMTYLYATRKLATNFGIKSARYTTRFHIRYYSLFHLLNQYSKRLLLTQRLYDFSRLIFIVNIILATNAYGLNVINITTSNAIQGHEPYFTIDNGASKLDKFDDFFWITLSDGTTIQASQDTSSFNNPIELPLDMETFASIKTFVPLSSAGNASYPKLDMAELLKTPYSYFGDDDGDGYDNTGEITATATGNLSLKWESPYPGQSTFYDITPIVQQNINALMNNCNGPYKLTITASDTTLITPYGDPQQNTIPSSSHSYYIKPNKLLATTCYAQPSLVYHNQILPSGGYDVSGKLWDEGYSSNDGGITRIPGRGYKVINASNSGDYNGANQVFKNNFPSTGSHGLYFYLIFGGVDPQTVLNANGPTVNAEEGGNVTLSLSAGSTEKWEYFGGSFGIIEPALKVKLNGPRYDSNDKLFRPSTFKIYLDRGKTKLLYEFRLMRWYIPQPVVNYAKSTSSFSEVIAAQNKAKEYCSNFGFGYRLAEVNDYVNTLTPKNGWNIGIPNRSGTWYSRQLSYRDNGQWIGGINSEWGCMVNDWNATTQYSLQCSGYSGSDWDSYYYLTASQASNATVSANNGKPIINHLNFGIPLVYDFNQYGDIYRIACVTP